MNRLLVTLSIALALPLLSGGSASAELGPIGGVDYTLEGYSADIALLEGCSEHRRAQDGDSCVSPSPIGVLSARFVEETRFREAQLELYRTTDPCREVAALYNSLLDLQSLDSSIFSTMVALRCVARVQVDQKADTIRSFQPVP